METHAWCEGGIMSPQLVSARYRQREGVMKVRARVCAALRQLDHASVRGVVVQWSRPLAISASVSPTQPSHRATQHHETNGLSPRSTVMRAQCGGGQRRVGTGQGRGPGRGRTGCRRDAPSCARAPSADLFHRCARVCSTASCFLPSLRHNALARVLHCISAQGCAHGIIASLR
jgi:hypothetical protein